MKCSGDNVILRGIVHVVTGFPIHFMFYRGNLDYFSNRVLIKYYYIISSILVKPPGQQKRLVSNSELVACEIRLPIRTQYRIQNILPDADPKISFFNVGSGPWIQQSFLEI